MYIPVLKNRAVEMSVLKTLFNLPLTNQIIPLVEIIQEKLRSNSDNSFTDDLGEIFENSDKSFMVDIIKTNIPNNTHPTVREFLTKVNRNREFYINTLLSFNKFDNAIPVISYNPESYNIYTILDDVRILRHHFKKLAFRITSPTFSSIFPNLIEVLQPNDFLILDIGLASHINPVLKKTYHAIKNLKQRSELTVIIVNSTKSATLTNVSLEDGEPIFEIDNSLMETYNTIHKFDGFGDYACITDQLPSKGGGISPAGIYYSFDNNFFIGYRRNKDLAEFENHIAPSIINSDYWAEFTSEHHTECPGCKLIYDIAHNKEPGKSQAKWKAITMYHYIYTLSENLF